MYNAEKYIAECLDSIFAQTFQNFEVIVVDDCSTDSSCAIVESYAEKFGGRLILAHMEKNSGGCALPRNKGLLLASGEYVFFMDADDLLIKTALEEMYLLYKSSKADAIFFDNFFETNEDLSVIRRHKVTDKSFFANKPTFEAEDLNERFKSWFDEKFMVYAWLKLVKRELLLDNEIFFPYIAPAEDTVWTYALFFYAKKLLHTSKPLYIYRLSANSVMRTARSPQEAVNFRLHFLAEGLKALDKLISKLEFFKINPQYHYAVLEKFLIKRFVVTFEESLKLPSYAVYEAIKQEFGSKFGEYDILISALYSNTYAMQRVNVLNVQKFNDFAAQTQKRIAKLEAEIKRLKA